MEAVTADLVVSSVTVTYSGPPLVDARWLKPALAAITDLALPWDPEGMSAFDALVIDDHRQEAASRRAWCRALVSCDLAELVDAADAPRFIGQAAASPFAASPSAILPWPRWPTARARGGRLSPCWRCQNLDADRTPPRPT